MKICLAMVFYPFLFFDIKNATELVAWNRIVTSQCEQIGNINTKLVYRSRTVTAKSKITSSVFKLFKNGGICVLSYYFITNGDIANSEEIATIDVECAGIYNENQWNAKSTSSYSLKVNHVSLMANEAIPSGTTCSGQLVYVANN